MGKPRPLDLDPSVYLRDDYVYLDFETTNLDKGSPVNRSNKIVLAAWICGPTHPMATGGKVRTHFGSEFEQRELCEAILQASFIIAHHAKFECGWLFRCGLELRDLIVWCTQIGEYVLAGNRKFIGGFGLDATAKRYGTDSKMCYVSELISAGICPSSIPEGELKSYCVRDVESGFHVFLRQRTEIFRLSLENVLYGRCLQTPMLADIESRGVQLAEGSVFRRAEDTIRVYSGTEQELERSFGAINWRSPKQIARLVYEELGFEELKDHRGKVLRSEAGNQLTGEEIIGRLAARTPRQQEFKRLWTSLAPLKKKVQILENMVKCVKDDGGHVYAQFNQTITQNHRLSSTGGKYGFQFQNFPRSFKDLFRAWESDWVVIEGDCPQLEFRTGADLADDPVAKGDILGRRDVHKFTAEIIGCSRQDAKPHTFKPLYGGRSGTKRERAYYDAFRERYSVIYDTQMSWVYHVLEHKSLTIPTGLTFYWPETEVTSSGYITNTPAIFNYPISSFATADISQLSLNLVWRDIGDMDSYICNTVHDSGIVESPKEELDKIKQIMVHCYTDKIYDVLSDLYGYSFSTPLGVGIKAGEVWGAGNEEKFENEQRFQWAA